MNSPFPPSSCVPGEGRVVAKLLPNSNPGLETITYRYPLKLVTPLRPSEAKSALVFLLSYGGGLVGGDRVHLTVEVHPQARLTIATQGHTKIYPSTSLDDVTRQHMQTSIGKGGALCLLPDPVQPFADSAYEQVQIFRLASTASLCMLDWVTHGRGARGENWSVRRWAGRNEIWLVGRDGMPSEERLLVRDAVLLDGDQSHTRLGALRKTMHGHAIFGTLILRGPLVQALGDFFLAEFAALPRIGARDFRGDSEGHAEASPAQKWRLQRQEMEKRSGLLWSAAQVRGCAVVKLGAPAVETARVWLGSMLAQEGTIESVFGHQALLCMK